MKIYAIKSITWIEDYYKIDDSYDNFLFLSKVEAENKLREIICKYREPSERFIGIVKDGIEYTVLYNECNDIIASEAKEYLWENEHACWYYIKELNVQ